MAVGDLIRCGLVALMAIPVPPLLPVAVLLVVIAHAQPLFSAGRNAILPAVLPGTASRSA